MLPAMSVQLGLLFIADIGGYTRFMKLHRMSLAHTPDHGKKRFPSRDSTRRTPCRCLAASREELKFAPESAQIRGRQHTAMIHTDIGPAALSPFLRQHLALFACPACGGSLQTQPAAIGCAACGRTFTADDGIPRLFWSTDDGAAGDVTDSVKAFYEETPFPNYDDLDSPESLRVKAEAGLFARLLNEQIVHGSKILECGCGTGQLSNYLGLTWGRTVFATDICVNSLRLGQRFKDRHGIAGVGFVQMNLFWPVFRPETFDVVIANGVLHHTGDPFRAFRSILRCLKRGGFIVVGLYNTYGRLTTDLRRLVFRLTGDRFQFLDPRLRRKHLGSAVRLAWFKDQYKHPHESTHTLGEVLGWFDRSAVAFMTSIPGCTATDAFSAQARLFEPHPRGSSMERLFVQLGMSVRGGREGGFFTMIGRKES